MMTGEPHPQRCETCESFHEERQTQRYRCSWNCCYVHPKDECPCRPSHWEADHSASEPVPAEGCDRCRFVKDCTPLYVPPCYNGAAVEAAKQTREKVLDELAEPTIRASEEAEQNGDYVSQTCYEDVLKWIAAIRQQEGKP